MATYADIVRRPRKVTETQGRSSGEPAEFTEMQQGPITEPRRAAGNQGSVRPPPATGRHTARHESLLPLERRAVKRPSSKARSLDEPDRAWPRWEPPVPVRMRLGPVPDQQENDDQEGTTASDIEATARSSPEAVRVHSLNVQQTSSEKSLETQEWKLLRAQEDIAAKQWEAENHIINLKDPHWSGLRRLKCRRLCKYESATGWWHCASCQQVKKMRRYHLKWDHILVPATTPVMLCRFCDHNRYSSMAAVKCHDCVMAYHNHRLQALKGSTIHVVEYFWKNKKERV